ncbi:Hypothetical_protein [Hexamita inflata]|uniref:Hypothetical_protein n=1 Tax=Hexamita inflata TaxID=28002 RepID=A0AA86RI39_9EUKA|nr:Hypothetical protein HINF_LOCUS62441 [Hexamita inflata]
MTEDLQEWLETFGSTTQLSSTIKESDQKQNIQTTQYQEAQQIIIPQKLKQPQVVVPQNEQHEEIIFQQPAIKAPDTANITLNTQQQNTNPVNLSQNPQINANTQQNVAIDPLLQLHALQICENTRVNRTNAEQRTNIMKTLYNSKNKQTNDIQKQPANPQQLEITPQQKNSPLLPMPNNATSLQTPSVITSQTTRKASQTIQNSQNIVLNKNQNQTKSTQNTIKIIQAHNPIIAQFQVENECVSISDSENETVKENVFFNALKTSLYQLQIQTNQINESQICQLIDKLDVNESTFLWKKCAELLDKSIETVKSNYLQYKIKYKTIPVEKQNVSQQELLNALHTALKNMNIDTEVETKQFCTYIKLLPNQIQSMIMNDVSQKLQTKPEIVLQQFKQIELNADTALDNIFDITAQTEQCNGQNQTANQQPPIQQQQQVQKQIQQFKPHINQPNINQPFTFEQFIETVKMVLPATKDMQNQQILDQINILSNTMKATVFNMVAAKLNVRKMFIIQYYSKITQQVNIFQQQLKQQLTMQEIKAIQEQLRDVSYYGKPLQQIASELKNRKCVHVDVDDQQIIEVIKKYYIILYGKHGEMQSNNVKYGKPSVKATQPNQNNKQVKVKQYKSSNQVLSTEMFMLLFKQVLKSFENSDPNLNNFSYSNLYYYVHQKQLVDETIVKIALASNKELSDIRKQFKHIEQQLSQLSEDDKEIIRFHINSKAFDTQTTNQLVTFLHKENQISKLVPASQIRSFIVEYKAKSAKDSVQQVTTLVTEETHVIINKEAITRDLANAFDSDSESSSSPSQKLQKSNTCISQCIKSNSSQQLSESKQQSNSSSSFSSSYSSSNSTSSPSPKQITSPKQQNNNIQNIIQQSPPAQINLSLTGILTEIPHQKPQQNLNQTLSFEQKYAQGLRHATKSVFAKDFSSKTDKQLVLFLRNAINAQNVKKFWGIVQQETGKGFEYFQMEFQRCIYLNLEQEDVFKIEQHLKTINEKIDEKYINKTVHWIKKNVLGGKDVFINDIIKIMRAKKVVK